MSPWRGVNMRLVVQPIVACTIAADFARLIPLCKRSRPHWRRLQRALTDPLNQRATQSAMVPLTAAVTRWDHPAHNPTTGSRAVTSRGHSCG